MDRTQHHLSAFIAALGAVAVLSIMDAVMKHLVLVIGLVAVSIWRSAANLLISAALYLPRQPIWPGRKALRLHVTRGIVVTIMAGLFFWGIGRVPLAQAIALTFIAPLIAMILAAATLSEQISARSLAGALGALAGVIVIVVGQAEAKVSGDVLLGIAAILGSALCYACNIVLMRHQALAARPLEINFFQSATVMALWLVSMAASGAPAWPGFEWRWIALAAFLSTCGTLIFAWGYARAPASYLAVSEYSGFLWASVLGWLFFREPLSQFTIAGVILIVSGCLIAARRPSLPPEIEVAA